MQPIDEDEDYYRVKNGLNYSCIENGDISGIAQAYPGVNIITTEEGREISNFCKKYEPLKGESNLMYLNNVIRHEKQFKSIYYIEEKYTNKYPILYFMTNNHKYIGDLAFTYYPKYKYIYGINDKIHYQPVVLKEQPSELLKIVFDGPSKTVFSYSVDRENNEVTLYSILFDNTLYVL